jgi:hypothetical protein
MLKACPTYPRVLAARYLAAEATLRIQIGEIMGTFSVCDQSLGEILILLFDAWLKSLLRSGKHLSSLCQFLDP